MGHATAQARDQTVADAVAWENVEGNVYFPSSTISDKSFFSDSATKTVCPWKGTASYYDINVNGETLKDAAWYYPQPKEAALNIKDHVAFGNAIELRKTPNSAWMSPSLPIWRAAYRAAPWSQLSRYTACAECLVKARSFSSKASRLAATRDDLHLRPPQLQHYDPIDSFPERHIGPRSDDTKKMLKQIDTSYDTLDDFVKDTIPADILTSEDPGSHRIRVVNSEFEGKWDTLPVSAKFGGMAESVVSRHLNELSNKNQQHLNFIGRGYFGTIVPEVIKRNVLENPAWYTSYTPYQAEISQGRMESLLNFQTMVTDMTALPIANASLLDEATAAAEAMALSLSTLPMSRQKRTSKAYVVSHRCHQQTKAVLESRAHGLGIRVEVGDIFADDFKLIRDQGEDLIGVLAQYPDVSGTVSDMSPVAKIVHELKATFSVATDLLALTHFKAPGEFGADIAVGSAQRLGVPMGYGGPHAAFLACADKFKRKIPGRLVGVSKDRLGNKAIRLALQTREQHIRREKATSNICTAQALLANMSAFYTIYHGPLGLREISDRIRLKARTVISALKRWDYHVLVSGEGFGAVWDTVVVRVSEEALEKIRNRAMADRINMNFQSPRISVTLDETHTRKDISKLLACFKPDDTARENLSVDIMLDLPLPDVFNIKIPKAIRRTSRYLTHPVFNQHHSETELLRYIHHLESKDLSLVHSMIPLGSCTMKLNATTEMTPVSLPGFSSLHPFAPQNQAQGYRTLIRQLSFQLNAITGMATTSLMPNSGAQGEFAGLRVIKKYLDSREGGNRRTVCLIPVSAHGTNPASAAMAGMSVVPLKCDPKTGNLDVEDLKAKCLEHKEDLAAIMVTYPSTFGVFEPRIKEVCAIVHEHGGQVYMDGANLNAQIGLCKPGDIGADVCHLNLHKTFCIPHGGGGPGVGPIAVKEHLAPYLPTHPFLDPHKGHVNTESQRRGIVPLDRSKAISPVSAAPFGSASILPISWAYIMMMGPKGLKYGTQIALLNANYILARLKPYYPILYTNENGRCAHEFILDARKFKKSCGVEAIDIAKRLQDYGFHAPTMSWPVANTLMIEPTESESKEELDRFCDALISIRKEIEEVESGGQPQTGNLLKMAPHSQMDLLSDEWDRPYTRSRAAYPLPWLTEKKFWPSVTRVDDGKSSMVLRLDNEGG
ncbi:MAG: hypothetical protein Q9160_000035 [Pyrenula sp. 1 TL-2023]